MEGCLVTIRYIAVVSSLYNPKGEVENNIGESEKWESKISGQPGI